MKLEIEIFRLVSVFGIVWFHSGISHGTEIAYSGLIFFIITSVYFAVKSQRQHTILDRAKRLLVPCFIWAIFYGAVMIKMNGFLFYKDFGLLRSILMTPSIHLWYLPFMFFVLVTIDSVRSVFNKAWFSYIIGISAIILISLSPLRREFEIVKPYGQYVHALPAVLIGIFLGTYNKSTIWKIILAGILISIITMTVRQEPGIGITYLTGIIPCYFLFRSWAITSKQSMILSASSATFGVYLIHVFVILVLDSFDVKEYWLATLAFILSLAIIMVFRKFAPQYIVKYVC